MDRSLGFLLLDMGVEYRFHGLSDVVRHFLRNDIRPTAGWLLGTGSVSGVMYVLD